MYVGMFVCMQECAHSSTHADDTSIYDFRMCCMLCSSSLDEQSHKMCQTDTTTSEHRTEDENVVRNYFYFQLWIQVSEGFDQIKSQSSMLPFDATDHMHPTHTTRQTLTKCIPQFQVGVGSALVQIHIPCTLFVSRGAM